MQLLVKMTGKMILRAIHDFDPDHINQRQEIELYIVLQKFRLLEFYRFYETCEADKHGQKQAAYQNGRHQEEFEKFETGKDNAMKYEGEINDWLCNRDLKEFNLSSQDKYSNPNPEDGLSTVKDEGYRIIGEETCDIQSQSIIKVKGPDMVKRKNALLAYQEDLQVTSAFDRGEDSDEEMYTYSYEAKYKQNDYRSMSCDSYQSYDGSADVEMSPNAAKLTFRRGDKMETIFLANIGDKVGWWMVRHLDSGLIGFIRKDSFVIENDQEPSKTTLHELPLELLDIILEKSFLRLILKPSSQERDEEAVRSLATVDFCWFKRITRRRFKNRIWPRLKDFYEATTKMSAIIRNNRSFLLENVQPNDELLLLLTSCNCITDEQCHLIQRQRSIADKNAEVLYAVRPFEETNYAHYVKCLRKTNQRTVARIVENGGVVIRCEVSVTCTTYVNPQKLHETISDLRNRTELISPQTDEAIGGLREKGIEIVNSQLNRQTLVVWIWCHSQAALEHLQTLYESNQLKKVLMRVEDSSQSTSEIMKSTMVDIDSSQFKKTVVVCSIFINFIERLDVGKDEKYGVTKMRDEIYVLCQPSVTTSPVIRVFEDQSPFHCKKKIEITEIKSPWDIASSEKENCLFVSDYYEKCIWKVTRETGDQHKIIKWMTTDYTPFNISVSSDGHLLVVSDSSSILRIYGSDAALLRFIRLPGDMKELFHAVETSIGNFIILHGIEKQEEGDSVSSGADMSMRWGVCKVTSDGQMVICRFTPSNEIHRLYYPRYISLDSDDQVFVADRGNCRVVLLDSDLQWIQILCPTKEEVEEEKRIFEPHRLWCDEEKKQLIVGGFCGGVNIYTLKRQ